MSFEIQHTSIFSNSFYLQRVFISNFSIWIIKLQMKWKLIHLPPVYLLNDRPHNALKSHLKLVSGFRKCISNVWFCLCVDYFVHISFDIESAFLFSTCTSVMYDRCCMIGSLSWWYIVKRVFTNNNCSDLHENVHFFC